MKQPIKKTQPKPISREVKQNAISLVINSVLVLFVYYGAMSIDQPVISQIVTIAYMIILGGFLIGYIIYNFAFTRKNITPDMLPDSWSDDKKEQYISEGKTREKKSRWMLTVIIPFLFTFLADALYLFVWNGFLQNLFS